MEFGIAVFAGLFGALLGYLVQVFVSVRSSEVAAITDQISDVRRIEKYATAYWLNDQSTSNIADKDLAAKLRGALQASAAFEVSGPEILGFRFEEYTDLMLQLDELATGGEFESAHKNVDPVRVVGAMRVTGELVAHLRVCRKYVFLWR